MADKNYDGVTSGGFVVSGNVDGYIYKSYESLLGREVGFGEHIKCMVEDRAGAHYYAHGPYTNMFSRAKALVDLRELKINRRGRGGAPCRNAYLCLGFISGGRLWHIDTGLCNNQEKDVWAAFLCDFGLGTLKGLTYKDIAGFNTDNYKNAVYFETELNIGLCDEKSDIVECVYRFLSEDKSVIGEITAVLENKAGEVFVRENGRPLARFVRFISLVPRTGKGEDDIPDSTFLKGSFENLEIDGLPWSEDKLDYVWSVQAANIKSIGVSRLGGGKSEDSDFISLCHEIRYF